MIQTRTLMIRTHATVLLVVFGTFIGAPCCCLGQDEANAAVDQDEGLQFLDEAMQAKLAASRLRDLEEVIELCQKAIDAGLSEANQQFATEMKVSTLYERAELLVTPIFEGRIDQTWMRRRQMAMESLKEAAKIDKDNGEVFLLLAKLCRLPGGDTDLGIQSATRAIELMSDFPARKSEALFMRAQFASSVEARMEDLDAAIVADEENDDAWRERGQAKLESGDVEGAITDFQHILGRNNADEEALAQIVRILAAEEKFEEALNYIDKAIEADPNSTTGYAIRSNIRLMQGELDGAIEDLDKALQRDPENLGMLMTRARVRAMRGDFELATGDVERVLAIRPGLSQAILLRADIAVDQGEFQQAILDFKRLLADDSENPALLLQLAGVLLADERPRRAIEVYTQIIDGDDEDLRWMALRGRADARLAISEHAQAIDDYQQALKYEPEDDGILNNLAWVMATTPEDSLRDPQRAKELAQKACELTDYKAAHILSTLAACFADAGEFEKAIEWSAKAVELGEGEMKENLAEELESYRQEKPWRESQNQQENPQPEPTRALDDDLVIEDADSAEREIPIPDDP